MDGPGLARGFSSFLSLILYRYGADKVAWELHFVKYVLCCLYLGMYKLEAW